MKYLKPNLTKPSSIQKIIHQINLALEPYEFSLSLNDFIENDSSFFSKPFIFSESENCLIGITFYYHSNKNISVFLNYHHDEHFFVQNEIKFNELYRLTYNLLECLNNFKCLSKTEMVIKDIIQ